MEEGGGKVREGFLEVGHLCWVLKGDGSRYRRRASHGGWWGGR